MKKFAKRLTALALALALTAGALEQTALASMALGDELVDRTVELAEGVSWTAQSLWAESKSDLRTENYLTYTPGSGVTPVIYNGTYVASRSTVEAAAAALEAQGYRVIAGINGGFFNSNGTIVGILMTEGVIRSLDLYNGILLGFTRDGHVFIDESGRTMTKTVSWKTQNGPKQYNLVGFNAARNNDALGGLYLYNQDYASKVSYDASRGCVAVLLSPTFAGGDDEDDAQPPETDGEGTGDDAQPPETGGEGTGDGAQPPEAGDGETGDNAQPPEASDGETGDGTQPPETGDGDAEDDPQPSEFNRDVVMNGTLTLSVEEIIDTRAGDKFNGDLTDGRYMLYANYYNGNDSLLNALRSLTPGQKLTVAVSGVSEQWADAAYGISGLNTLLWDGEVVPGLAAGDAPRTAVGIKADGTAVFYTIDGRRSGYSVGATYTPVAQRLQELGCVTAVALDGGGSTSLGGTLPGQQKFELLNWPSQTNRPLNNFIFLLEGDGYAGMKPGIYLSSDTQVVLTGASLNVSAVEYDQWGKEVPKTTPDASDPPETRLDWSATGGTIQGNGMTAVYTAGDTVGAYAISAGSGSELPVWVVDTLSSLWVTWDGFSEEEDTLYLKPRETVDLSAAGTWWNLPVALGGSGVTWELDAAIGTIDASGRFTAEGWNEAVSGSITATAGGQTATVQVTVQAYPFTDIKRHWSVDYVLRLYELGLTQGIAQPDGTYTFNPTGMLSRGELLIFITRLLHVDTDEYQDVELPFADADTIPDWMLPSVKAMYALGVLNGSDNDGKLYANVHNGVKREEAMTMLGRVLAAQESQDLSGFADSGSVSGWARSYIETLVGLGVVQGSDGKLNPKSNITRGEAAKLLAELDGLEKAELTPRPSGPETDEPETQEPDDTGDTPDDRDQRGEDTGDTVPPDDAGDAPGGQNEPEEGTGDAVSQGEPSVDPLG